nr:hypothetical protein [uncultured Flavobacterium sp.]
MKNKLLLIFVLAIIFFNCGFAQTTKSQFHKTVDSINAIIKKSPQAYYIDSRKASNFITKISVTDQGIVHFTDSIPELEITTEKPEITTKRVVLISDCECPLKKNSRTLDLFAIKKWDIHFPFADLKDNNDERYGRFIGFKKLNLDRLKEQFDKLTALCKKEEEITK